MKRCPVCGCDLTRADKVRRARRIEAVQRWQAQNRAEYNAYQRDYQRKLRQRKREAASQ